MAADYSYKEGIVASRLGCLGSSDAEMVYQAGLTQRIGKNLEKRLAVLKGFIEAEQKDILNFRLGNALEQAWYQYRQSFAALQVPPMVTIASNPEYHSTHRYSNFLVIDHIDIEEMTHCEDGSLILHWSEVKCSSKEVLAAKDYYLSQLAWHWMCLNEKMTDSFSIVSASLHLDVYPIEEVKLNKEQTDVVNFDAAKMQSVIIEWSEVEQRIGVIMDGLHLIDKFLSTFTHYEVDSLDVDADDLGDAASEVFAEIERVMTEKKMLEDREKELRTDILTIMMSVGAKTVRTPFTTFSKVDASVTTRFDSRKFKNDHPELYTQYLTESKTSESITIKARKD